MRASSYPASCTRHFQGVLLVALEEFHGTDWSDDLSRQWREAIESAVRIMFEGYDERAHV